MTILYISSGYKGIYPYLEESIQQAIQENGQTCLYFQPSQGLEQLIVATRTLKPFLALVMLGEEVSFEMLKYLKNSGIKTACWLTEDPFYMDKSLEIATLFDYVFTIDQGALKQYEKNQIQAYHLPLGTNPSIFHPIAVEDEYKSELLLVGYPYPSRVALVHFLLAHTANHITLIGRGWWNRLQKRWRNSPHVRIKDMWMEPDEVARYYNGAKIVLNPHRSHNFVFNHNTQGIINESVNNRTFDIAACGVFQLIEDMPDIPKLFQGNELIVYQNASDCLDKLQIYMNNECERRMVAQRAREVVLKNHTFPHRLHSLLEHVALS